MSQRSCGKLLGRTGLAHPRDASCIRFAPSENRRGWGISLGIASRKIKSESGPAPYLWALTRLKYAAFRDDAFVRESIQAEPAAGQWPAPARACNADRQETLA